MAALAPLLRLLTIPEIISITEDTVQLVIPREHRSPKEKLIAWVTANATVALEDAVETAVRQREARRTEARVLNAENRRRRRTEQQRERRQARRLDVQAPVSVTDRTCDPQRYLDLPTKEQVFACYEAFYNATGNTALRMAVCAVCAREVGVREDDVQVIPISDIPNGRKLVLRERIPEHHIVNGMLLEQAGLIEEDGHATHAHVCRDCLMALKSPSTGPPPYSLANDMWIGPIPWELETLTLPEQMLIALLYPRVYVFKLYPRGRKRGFDDSDAGLQRGMRGTVSTYKLDSAGIVAMLEGNLMPRPPEILSAVLSITFIGRKRPTARGWLRSNFRVRRAAVHRALVWLKTHNPKYYGNLDIDPTRLQRLPEDDVPVEIEAIVRHNEDELIVEQESQGYVPPDDEGDEDEGGE